MSRTHRHRLSLIVCVVMTLPLTGCRQMGGGSSPSSPTPIAPSGPSFPAAGDSSLQQIPPMPPAAASTFDSSAYGPPRRLGWSRPRYAPQQPAIESFVMTEPETPTLIAESTAEVETTSAEDNDRDDEVTSLIPPTTMEDDGGLVPPPRDLEDDELALNAVATTPTMKGVVEFDLAEFLAELDEIPAPIHAQTQSDPVLTPVPVTVPVVSGPVPVSTSSMMPPPWPPHGHDHGISIHPGPMGTGNRLESFPGHVSPWNSGRVAGPAYPPLWESQNGWAGQNSDWGGRQFR